MPGTLSRVGEWSHVQFGEYLDAVMRAKGIRNDADLAQRAGFKQTQVSNWRRGKARPSPTLLDRLAQALDVPARNLYSLAGYNPGDDMSNVDLKVVPPEIQELVDLYHDPDLTDGDRATLLQHAKLTVTGLRALLGDHRSGEAASAAGQRRAG